MKAIVYKLHIWIVLYAIYLGYGIWEDHQKKVKILNNQVTSLQKKIKKENQDLKELEVFQSQMEEARAAFREVESEFKIIQKKLPSSLNHSKYKQMFKDIADKINIKNVSISDKQKEIKKGFYYIKKYDFTAKGTFLQFLIFLERITEAEQLFNVKELDFKADPKDKRGRFQLTTGRITIEAYRYNDRYDEELRAEREEKSKKAKKRRGGKK